MTTSSTDQKLLEIYKGELAPPANWELVDAKAYRKQLDGAKTGKIARYAPIGRVPMSDTSVPASFPFIQFTSETPDDDELLRRGNLIRNAMKKYDPYSSDNFEPKIKSFTGDMVSPDRVRYAENLVDAPSVKDPVIEYIKTLPPSPGPKMQILTSAKAFQNSDYDADKLYFWTDGKIDQSNMLKIHHAIKRHGGDFLLKLKEDHMEEVNRKKDEIDQQLKEFMTFGATGNYVNRYSFMEVLGQLSDDDANRMMYDFDIDDSTYSLFSKVLDIDSKGYRKWKRYATAQFARYLRFMTMYSKEKVTTTGTDKDMEKYETLNAEAAANRARIDAIRRVRAARTAPPAPAPAATSTPAPAGSNAATIQSQNDAVDQFINDVKATTTKDELDQILNSGSPDTSLLQGKRDNDIGQAVRDKEAELNAQSQPQPPDYANMTLVEVSKLDEQTIRDNFNMEALRKLLGYINPRGSKQRVNKFTDKEFIEYDDLIKKVQAKEKFDPDQAKKDKQRYEDEKEYTVGKCVKFNGTAEDIGTIISVDLDKRMVNIEIYRSAGTIMPVAMDRVTPLTKEDCDKLKEGVDLALALTVKAQEEEEQKRKAEEEEEQKRLEEEEATKAQKEIDEALELTAEAKTSDWFVLKQGETDLFYLSDKDRKDGLLAIIDKIPKNKHILKYEKLSLTKANDFHLFEMDSKRYKVKLVNDLEEVIVTRNVGKALKDEEVEQGPDVSVILEQAKDGLTALQRAGIVHQDIKLENMAWDGQNLTIIDFGNAREASKACNSTFNGKEYNILPPDGVSSDPYFADKWSLVLALLQYGQKTLYAKKDSKPKSRLTQVLFSATTEKEVEDGCFKLRPASEQPGLMFHDDGSNITHRKKSIKKLLTGALFYHLWFIFNSPDDLQSQKTQRGLVPGYENLGKATIDGLVIANKDKHDYLEDLVERMGTSNVDFAKKWVEGHLRWESLQSIISNKEMQLITVAKMKDKDTTSKHFKETTVGDLGETYYGIPTEQVVKIFELIGDKSAANATFQSVASLDYDSFSDAELDELEDTYEPYDEEELDRLMSEYDSSSGAEAMSYNSYNSESEQSIESDSYDSDSD